MQESGLFGRVPNENERHVILKNESFKISGNLEKNWSFQILVFYPMWKKQHISVFQPINENLCRDLVVNFTSSSCIVINLNLILIK